MSFSFKKIGHVSIDIIVEGDDMLLTPIVLGQLGDMFFYMEWVVFA